MSESGSALPRFSVRHPRGIWILPMQSACMVVFSSKQGGLRSLCMLCALVGSIFWTDATLAETIPARTALPNANCPSFHIDRPNRSLISHPAARAVSRGSLLSCLSDRTRRQKPVHLLWSANMQSHRLQQCFNTVPGDLHTDTNQQKRR
jgi:hypothetical protein